MKKKKPTLFSVLMIHCGLFSGLTLIAAGSLAVTYANPQKREYVLIALLVTCLAVFLSAVGFFAVLRPEWIMSTLKRVGLFFFMA